MEYCFCLKRDFDLIFVLIFIRGTHWIRELLIFIIYYIIYFLLLYIYIYIYIYIIKKIIIKNNNKKITVFNWIKGEGFLLWFFAFSNEKTILKNLFYLKNPSLQKRLSERYWTLCETIFNKKSFFVKKIYPESIFKAFFLFGRSGNIADSCAHSGPTITNTILNSLRRVFVCAMVQYNAANRFYKDGCFISFGTPFL